MTEELHPCPCCGERTLSDVPPGTFEICTNCYWEDDPVQFDNPDYVGGANYRSLNQSREFHRRHARDSQGNLLYPRE